MLYMSLVIIIICCIIILTSVLFDIISSRSKVKNFILKVYRNRHLYVKSYRCIIKFT